MKSNKKEFTINVHLVNHQVFYTPIYLCEKDYKLKFTIDDYALSDKKLVDELFKEPNSKDDEIDIFVTGGPDVVNYLRAKSNTEKGKVFFWIPVVDRFPLPLVKAKVDKDDDLHSTLSIRHIPELSPPSIFSPPEDTTLHYFLSKYYDNNAFKKKYLEMGLTEEEKKAIIDDLSKNNSLFNGKLRPQQNFNKIVEELEKDKNAWGFWLSLDEGIRKVKKFNPPMEVIVFTCIYTKKDVWENERKRNFLQDFCKHVSLNINEIHEFNWHYHRDKKTKQYETESLSRVSPVFKILNKVIKTEEQKQQFVANLKFLAQHRIFATNLSNDLVLKGERFQEEKDNGKVDLYHKFGLYYWMSEGYVVNAIVATEEHLDKEMSEMAFKAGVSNATYNLGHFLKNRLTASKKNLNNLLDNLEKLNGKEEIRETLFSAIRDVERGENIGKMLNLISLLKKDDDDSVFKRLVGLKKDNSKEYLNSEKAFEFYRGVNSILNYLKSKGWNIEVGGIEKLKPVTLNNIGENEKGIFRPKSFFYDEILLELFLNACNHSLYENNKPNDRNFEIYFDDVLKGIVLVNEMSEKKHNDIKESLKQKNEEWVDLFFSTGLFNYAQILKLTKTGDIKVRVTKSKKKFYFNALLNLKGIKKKTK